jgi:hypothetical protein
MSHRGRYVFPLLASIYPVLVLADRTPPEWVRPVEFILPLAVSVLAYLMFLALAVLLTRDRPRRALIALCGVLAFTNYGVAWQALYNSTPTAEPQTIDMQLLPLLLFAVFLLWLLILRSRYSFLRACRYLNAFWGFLVAFTVPELFPHLVQHQSPLLHASAPPAALHAHLATTHSRPDVYLIILDKYTGVRSLQKNFGYDNSPFLRYLESRGFFVPRESRSNYSQTFLALASLLNWRYLDDLASDGRVFNHDWTPTYSLIQVNATEEFLRRQGYRYYFFPTRFEATASSRTADVQLPSPKRVQPEFYLAWRRMTALEAIVRLTDRGFPFLPEAADLTDWKFHQLELLPDSAGPKFVFAHLILPHEPYIYRSDCSHREPYWPIRDDGADSTLVKQAYIEQITCVNAKVRRLVEHLQSRSPVPPVILILADHGHGRLGRLVPELGQAPAEKVRERFDIFSAYFVPGHGRGTFYDSISPVNGIRASFATVFGLDLPKLQDLSHWSSSVYPYNFKLVP